MFTFRWPRSRVRPQYRYVVRFLSTKTDEAFKLTLAPGREYSTQNLPGLGFVDDSTIAFIQAIAEDGTRKTVTPRVRLGSLRSARHLSIDTLFQKYNADSDDQNTLITTVDLLRWVSNPSSIGRLDTLTKHITSTFRAPRNEDGSLLEELLRRDLGDDGSQVSDALLYIHNYNELLQITAGENWQSLSKGMASSTRLAMAKMEGELSELSLMPLNRALLVSVQDVLHGRERAAETAAWFRASAPDVHMGPELGVRTYGVVGQVSPDMCAPQFFDITGSMITSGSSRTTILYSGDPDFIRAYAPRMFFYMQLFPEYDYHLCIVASEASAAMTASALLELWHVSNSVRGNCGNADLTISYCDVPRDVRNAVSFFASARYLFAQAFIDRFPQGLWIQDIDLYPEADFTTYVAEMQRCDVAAPISRLMAGAVPWKRFMAGCVLLMPTAATKGFLESVGSYLRYWLVKDGSWMVDQNALSFGFETNEVCLYDIYSHGLPFRQSALAGRIESSTKSLKPIPDPN